jgi:hypothetical protein
VGVVVDKLSVASPRGASHADTFLGPVRHDSILVATTLRVMGTCSPSYREGAGGRCF